MSGLPEKLEVHLVAPDREVWVGEANIVSVRGVEGDLGILPGHIEMLAALDIGRVRIETDGDGIPDVIAAIDGGFLSVRRSGDVTRVDVLAEHVDLETEITEAGMESLERKAAEFQSAGEYDKARTMASKALVRRRLSS